MILPKSAVVFLKFVVCFSKIVGCSEICYFLSKSLMISQNQFHLFQNSLLFVFSKSVVFPRSVVVFPKSLVTKI